jgi:multiple sugar transport system ATP-binding protein
LKGAVIATEHLSSSVIAASDSSPDATISSRHVRLIVGIRPTDFADTGSADPSLPRLIVRPEVVEDLGAETHVIFPIDAPRVVADAVQAAVEDLADDEGGLFADDQRSLFIARVDGEAVIRSGVPVELAVDTRRMHSFDPVTGAAVGVGAAAATPVY